VTVDRGALAAAGLGVSPNEPEVGAGLPVLGRVGRFPPEDARGAAASGADPAVSAGSATPVEGAAGDSPAAWVGPLVSEAPRGVPWVDVLGDEVGACVGAGPGPDAVDKEIFAKPK
jgi:hypothetical protein